MPLNTIIIIISVLLVASVIGSILYTKKEQAAAEKRQLVSNFRYKADEALNFFDNLQTAGLEKIVYHFLLDRIVYNLNQAYNLIPSTPGVKLKLKSANSTMESLDSLTFPCHIHDDEYEFKNLLAKLNKLINYIDILVRKHLNKEKYYQIQAPSIEKNLTNLIPSIQQTILKFELEGFLKVAHKAADNGMAGTAKQNYLNAKMSLINSGINNAFTQKHMENIDGLLQLLESKTNPTTTDELLKSGEQHLSDNNVPLSDYEIDAKNALEEARSSQKELNEKNTKEDVFNRKTW